MRSCRKSPPWRCVRPPSWGLPAFEREAMIRRRFSTLPLPIQRCPAYIRVDVHENRARTGHTAHSATCWRSCACTAYAGAAVARGRLRSLPGATPVFGMPHTARRRLGCALQSPPSRGGRSRSSNPVREGVVRPRKALAGGLETIAAASSLGGLRFAHHCVRRAVGRRCGSPRWIGLVEKRGTRRDFEGRGERSRTPLRTVSAPLAPAEGERLISPERSGPSDCQTHY